MKVVFQTSTSGCRLGDIHRASDDNKPLCGFDDGWEFDWGEDLEVTCLKCRDSLHLHPNKSERENMESIKEQKESDFRNLLNEYQDAAEFVGQSSSNHSVLFERYLLLHLMKEVKEIKSMLKGGGK